MMSETLKMDEIDRQIIQLVQEQPSLTHTQIASKVNRSQPTVGMRIRKLEEAGVLQFQAGINIKSANLYFARVDLQTRYPEKIYEIVGSCPFMLNVFKLSGNLNMSILLAGFNLSELDKVVNYHFRNNSEVKEVSMNIITDVMSDFILPLDLNFDNCKCSLKLECSNHS